MLSGTADLFTVFLVFVRVGMSMAALPGFSASHVPMRVRLVLALLITISVAPVLASQMPALPGAPIQLALLVLSEAVIGAFFGLLPRLVLAALHAAGTFASFFGSFASAFVQDPVTDQQSSTLAGFLSTTGVLLVFVADLHHLMLRAVVEGYSVFPAGAVPEAGALGQTLARALAASFALGLQLSAPFLIVSIVSQVGLGLLNRLMPQLPVFFLGLPLQVGLQLWVMMLAISGIMMLFLNHFADAFALTLGR